MATDIKVTIHPGEYQTLTALLQMLAAGGTDTRDGSAKRAFLDLMGAQGRKLQDPYGDPMDFKVVLATMAEEILRNIQGA